MNEQQADELLPALSFLTIARRYSPRPDPLRTFQAPGDFDRD
jgi:hypothetical protein